MSNQYPYDGSYDPTRAYETPTSSDPFRYGGYDASGYDRDGYDRSGFDREGYRRDGFDADGYDRSGYNRAGINRAGYDRAGVNTFDRPRYGPGEIGQAPAPRRPRVDVGQIIAVTGARALLLMLAAVLVCSAATVGLTLLDSALPESYRQGAAPVDLTWDWGAGAGLLAAVIAAVVGLLVLLLGGTPTMVSLIGYSATALVAFQWYRSHDLPGMWPTNVAQVIVLALAGLVVTAAGSSLLVPPRIRGVLR